MSDYFMSFNELVKSMLENYGYHDFMLLWRLMEAIALEDNA
jgi:hypothetical protein